MATLAIVDDDAVTRETLNAYLSEEGFDVLQAGSAEDLKALLETRRIDLLLLDIRLPRQDGLTLTRELRAASDIGIILVSSRGDKLDRIIGLEMGADDYIAKPFEPREVLARVRNLLRRLDAPAQGREDRRRSFEGWTLYIDRMQLVDPTGAAVRLTGAEFELLSTFVSNAGRVLSRDYLLTVTTRRKTEASDRTIDSLVRRLRQVVEADPKAPRLIITVHGSGYLFAGDVAQG
ncbi:response regulator [Azospirillum sp.]|uniref:response regulator n=1 Tax=Azospirillum sp. TaxID=34012 RepID=UPI003D7464A5